MGNQYGQGIAAVLGGYDFGKSQILLNLIV
jgi:hypothetical protein